MLPSSSLGPHFLLLLYPTLDKRGSQGTPQILWWKERNTSLTLGLGNVFSYIYIAHQSFYLQSKGLVFLIPKFTPDPWEHRLRRTEPTRVSHSSGAEDSTFSNGKYLPNHYPKSTVVTFQHTKDILEIQDNPFPYKNTKNICIAHNSSQSTSIYMLSYLIITWLCKKRRANIVSLFCKWRKQTLKVKWQIVTQLARARIRSKLISLDS